ncbi:MAG: hypothetical protein ACO3IB_03035 [Phycisphaerales bacterium]
MKRAVLVRLAPVIVWLLAILPFVFTGKIGPSEAWDQDYYHRPVIKILSGQLPTPDFSNFGSATTPGYHLFMAVLDRLGADDLGLRLVSSLFGLAAAVVLARVVARLSRSEPLGAVAGVAFLLNPYVLSSAMFLTTDDLALLLMVLALASAVDSARQGSNRHTLFRAMAWSTGAAAVRQVLLWTAGLAWIGALMRSIVGKEPRPLRALSLAALSMLPAIALVAYFAWTWGGLTPPGFQGVIPVGFNPAPPVYMLALLGCWGACAAACHPRFLEAIRTRWAVSGAAAALVWASLVPTSPDAPPDGRRWGGILWSVAERLPVVLDRSLLVVVLAAAGGAVAGAVLWLARGNARRSETWTALAALALCTIAQMANSFCFERYLGPFAVVCIFIGVAPLVSEEAKLGRRPRFAGPLLAALVGLVLSVMSVHAKLDDVGPPPPRPDEFRPQL